MSSWKSACVEIGFKDFASICRICFAKTNLRNLQEMEYLVDVLQSLTDTEISMNDGLPQNICNKCIKKLEDISDFMDLSKYNDTVLRQVYLTQFKLKTNTVIWSSEHDIEDDGGRKIDSHNEALAESTAATDISNNSRLNISEPEIVESEENEREKFHDEHTTESDGSSYKELNLKTYRITKRAYSNTVICLSDDDEDDGCRKIDSHNEALAESTVTSDNSNNSHLNITCEPEILESEDNEREKFHDEHTTESDGSSYKESNLEINGINKRILSKEEYVRHLRRERNKKAAAKCRRKRLDIITNLEQTVEFLEKGNAFLRKQKEDLEIESTELVKVLARYKCSKNHVFTKSIKKISP